MYISASIVELTPTIMKTLVFERVLHTVGRNPKDTLEISRVFRLLRAKICRRYRLATHLNGGCCKAVI